MRVVVYQMAKVGSLAVVEALERSGIKADHVHRMSREHIAKMCDERRELGWIVPPLRRHDRLGPRLREIIVRRGIPARIVTLVREPIARNLSSYFEHLDAIWRMRNAHEKVPLEALCRGFVERYTHTEPLTWFDDEMHPVLDVDVYRFPFPADGHLTIRTAQFDVLVLKNELDDAAKSNALSRFFGVENIIVRRSNETGEKSTGVVFRRFTEAIRLSPEYVDEMMSARYTRHFYSEAERAAVRQK